MKTGRDDLVFYVKQNNTIVTSLKIYNPSML